MKKHLELLHRAISICDEISELQDSIEYDLENGKKDNAEYKKVYVRLGERKLERIYVKLLKLTK